MGLVKGVGIYERGKYTSREDGDKSWGYSIWSNMMERCYGSFSKRNPSYVGCRVAEEFIHFQDFMLWAEKQVGFYQPRFQLDKDILKPGNLVYSPDVCVFVPSQVNTVINRSQGSRGQYPLGVHFNTTQQMFVAQLYINNSVVNLGRFLTADDAFLAYKVAKEANIKAVAEKYRDVVDPRVYAALMSYIVTEDI